MRQETAALRDFSLAYVCSGSNSTDRYTSGGRGMSASPPKATVAPSTSNPPLRAKSRR